MTDVPHFDYPFRLGAAGAVEVEQDSPDDVQNCVLAVLKTEVGQRLDLPGFGISSQVLREGGVSLRSVDSALRQWEPRAEYELQATDVVDLAQTVGINMEAHSDA